MLPSKDQVSAFVRPAWVARAWLLPVGEAAAADDPAWERAGRWLLLWGLVAGVVYAAVFRGTWKWFGQYQDIRFVPMAVVLIADLAWGGHRLLRAAMRVLRPEGRRDEEAVGAMLALLLIVILKYAMLLALPLGADESYGWRQRFGILFPRPVYRPLVLMPLWGRWAAMLALCIGRPHPSEPSWLGRMAGGLRLPMILAGWLVCTALTMFYVTESPSNLPAGMVIGLAMLVLSYLVCFVLARRYRGVTRDTVLATSLAAEFGFLIFYLPLIRSVFAY